MPFLASEGCFRPLTASMTSEIKNNYAYVITQDICNNFIEVNFCVGCMVSQPKHMQQRSTTMSLINKLSFQQKIQERIIKGRDENGRDILNHENKNLP
jgi:hypothetical protein